MRNFIKSAVLCALATMSLTSAHAQADKTFYVCSGTGFTLVPSVATHTDYEWSEIGGSSNPVATTQNVSITAPTVGGTVYDTKQYTLSVRDSAGCWSEADTFTVYVLPAIQASITGNSGPYCANSSTTDTLTASVGSLTLPPGVAADQYAWTAGGNSVGANSSTLAFASGTIPGNTTYGLTVTYSLPAGIGGEKLTTCSGTDITTVTVTAAPTTPTVGIQ